MAQPFDEAQASSSAGAAGSEQRKIGRQQLDLDFFSRGLAACQGNTPEDGRAWRNGVYAVIHAQTQQQGPAAIERRCGLAGVSRADAVLPKWNRVSLAAALSGVVSPANEFCSDGGTAIVALGLLIRKIEISPNQRRLVNDGDSYRFQ